MALNSPPARRYCCYQLAIDIPFADCCLLSPELARRAVRSASFVPFPCSHDLPHVNSCFEGDQVYGSEDLKSNSSPLHFHLHLALSAPQVTFMPSAMRALMDEIQIRVAEDGKGSLIECLSTHCCDRCGRDDGDGDAARDDTCRPKHQHAFATVVWDKVDLSSIALCQDSIEPLLLGMVQSVPEELEETLLKMDDEVAGSSAKEGCDKLNPLHPNAYVGATIRHLNLSYNALTAQNVQTIAECLEHGCAFAGRRPIVRSVFLEGCLSVAEQSLMTLFKCSTTEINFGESIFEWSAGSAIDEAMRAGTSSPSNVDQLLSTALKDLLRASCANICQRVRADGIDVQFTEDDFTEDVHQEGTALTDEKINTVAADTTIMHPCPAHENSDYVRRSQSRRSPTVDRSSNVLDDTMPATMLDQTLIYSRRSPSGPRADDMSHCGGVTDRSIRMCCGYEEGYLEEEDVAINSSHIALPVDGSSLELSPLSRDSNSSASPVRACDLEAKGTPAASSNEDEEALTVVYACEQQAIPVPTPSAAEVEVTPSIASVRSTLPILVTGLTNCSAPKRRAAAHKERTLVPTEAAVTPFITSGEADVGVLVVSSITPSPLITPEVVSPTPSALTAPASDLMNKNANESLIVSSEEIPRSPQCVADIECELKVPSVAGKSPMRAQTGASRSTTPNRPTSVSPTTPPASSQMSNLSAANLNTTAAASTATPARQSTTPTQSRIDDYFGTVSTEARPTNTTQTTTSSEPKTPFGVDKRTSTIIDMTPSLRVGGPSTPRKTVAQPQLLCETPSIAVPHHITPSRTPTVSPPAEGHTVVVSTQHAIRSRSPSVVLLPSRPAFSTGTRVGAFPPPLSATPCLLASSRSSSPTTTAVHETFRITLLPAQEGKPMADLSAGKQDEVTVLTTSLSPRAAQTMYLLNDTRKRITSAGSSSRATSPSVVSACPSVSAIRVSDHLPSTAPVFSSALLRTLSVPSPPPEELGTHTPADGYTKADRRFSESTETVFIVPTIDSQPPTATMSEQAPGSRSNSQVVFTRATSLQSAIGAEYGLPADDVSEMAGGCDAVPLRGRGPSEGQIGAAMAKVALELMVGNAGQVRGSSSPTRGPSVPGRRRSLSPQQQTFVTNRVSEECAASTAATAVKKSVQQLHPALALVSNVTAQPAQNQIKTTRLAFASTPIMSPRAKTFGTTPLASVLLPQQKTATTAVGGAARRMASPSFTVCCPPKSATLTAKSHFEGIIAATGGIAQVGVSHPTVAPRANPTGIDSKATIVAATEDYIRVKSDLEHRRSATPTTIPSSIGIGVPPPTSRRTQSPIVQQPRRSGHNTGAATKPPSTSVVATLQPTSVAFGTHYDPTHTANPFSFQQFTAIAEVKDFVTQMRRASPSPSNVGHPKAAESSTGASRRGRSNSPLVGTIPVRVASPLPTQGGSAANPPQHVLTGYARTPSATTSGPSAFNKGSRPVLGSITTNNQRLATTTTNLVKPSLIPTTVTVAAAKSVIATAGLALRPMPCQSQKYVSTSRRSHSAGQKVSFLGSSPSSPYATDSVAPEPDYRPAPTPMHRW